MVLKEAIKIPFKLIKKVIPKKFPVHNVIETKKFPEPYRYFYETSGHKTDVVAKDGTNYILVWRQGISDRERRKHLEKLKKAV